MTRKTQVSPRIALTAIFASIALAACTRFDPRSTVAWPCGVGIPPPGHVLPEIPSEPRSPSDPITLTVRQDSNRLCYVANGSADAPVIRVRQGSELTVALRNEITDPATIDAVTAPGQLKTANAVVP